MHISHVANRSSACYVGSISAPLSCLVCPTRYSYHYTTNSFLIGRKCTVVFRNQPLWRQHCRLFMQYSCQGHSRSRVIMSSSRALCCFASLKKQKHDFYFFFLQCIIKQLLDAVFVISRIINVEVRVISRSRMLRLITFTSTLIILDITKTSPNNCLLLYIELSISILIGRKRKVNFRNQRPWLHNCRLYNYHVKDTQGHG